MKPDGVLDQMPLLRGLSPARRQAWQRVAVRERYPKGAVIFEQDAPARFIWLVAEGWVHLQRSTGGYPPVIVSTVTPKEALCGVSVLEPGFYSAAGVAGTDVDVVRIPAAAFVDAVRAEPFFAETILRACALRLRRTAEQYGDMAGPVPVRIARALVRLRGQFGDRIPVTHRELARMAWTTTESAIRAVRRLKREGVVTGQRGVMRVERPPQLEEMLHATNGHAEVRS